MSTEHNAQSVVLRKRYAHGFLPARVLVRSSRTAHNMHFGTRTGTSTAVSLGRGAGIVPIWRILHHITQSPVQPPARGAEPFYSDMNGPPLLLEVLALPGVDWLGQIQRATIPEVQTCPPHSKRGYTA
jgi:hypothetical protein